MRLIQTYFSHFEAPCFSECTVYKVLHQTYGLQQQDMFSFLRIRESEQALLILYAGVQNRKVQQQCSSARLMVYNKSRVREEYESITRSRSGKPKMEETREIEHDKNSYSPGVP